MLAPLANKDLGPDAVRTLSESDFLLFPSVMWLKGLWMLYHPNILLSSF